MIFVQPGDSNFFKFVSQPVFIMSESGSEEGEETDSGAVSADPASSANTTISEYPTQTRKDIFNQLSDNNQSVAKEVCFQSVPPPQPSQVCPLTNFFQSVFCRRIMFSFVPLSYSIVSVSDPRRALLGSPPPTTILNPP